MRFTSILLPFLASVVLAAPAEKAKPKTDLEHQVVAEIKNISKALTTLNDTLNTFQPFQILGVATALKIQQETNALEADISSAINSTMKSSQFSSSDSSKIATVTLKLVKPINTTLQNIINKKPAFASGALLIGDLTKTVYKSLVEQRNLTSTLGVDLANKLAAPFGSLAPSITNQLLGYFDTAITAYETCTGVVCLPPI